MKRQNSSISTTRSTASRTASALVWTPSMRRARRIAPSSTKNERRVYRGEDRFETCLIGISYAPCRHTSMEAAGTALARSRRLHQPSRVNAGECCRP
jgi:hypothetical protein